MGGVHVHVTVVCRVSQLLSIICPYNSVLYTLTSVSAALMVLAFWDTVQISSVTTSFTLEEPLGLLIIRLRSNFFTKLSKHFIGLWGAILIFSTTEESSMAPMRAERHCQDLSMFQVFHVLGGFLNIIQKKMFANK